MSCNLRYHVLVGLILDTNLHYQHLQPVFASLRQRLVSTSAPNPESDLEVTQTVLAKSHNLVRSEVFILV